jgi:hypothetical protein
MQAAISRLRHTAPGAHVSVVWLAAFWVAATLGLIGGASAHGAIAGAAAVVVALTALLAIRSGAASAMLRVSHRPVAVRLRDQSRRTPVPRQCDPDAAGRPRPRAPGHSPLAR